MEERIKLTLKRKLKLTVSQLIFCCLVGESINEKGYCVKTKEQLAQEINLSQMSVFTILKRLMAKGIVEKHKANKGWVKLTTKWYDVINEDEEWQIKRYNNK